MVLDSFRYYTGWHEFCNRKRYAAPADPWEIIRVDPATVEQFTTVSLRWGLGRVRGGGWDDPENCRRIGETKLYDGLVQRFEDGVAWEETAYDDWAREKLDEQDAFRGCEDIEEFRARRCAGLDGVAEDIRRDGYRPNYETTYDSPEDIDYIGELEPLVLVGRSGEIIWTEGYHRLVLGNILDVDEIPVYVLRRHERWQSIRDEIRETPNDELRPELREYVDHPDVQDIVA